MAVLWTVIKCPKDIGSTMEKNATKSCVFYKQYICSVVDIEGDAFNMDKDVKGHGRGTIKCMPRPLLLHKILTIFDFNHTQNLYLKIHVPIFFDLQTLNLNVPLKCSRR